MKNCRRLKWMVPNVKVTGEAIQRSASVTIQPSIHQIYTGNVYNEALHNAIGVEQDITATKTWSQVAMDIALVTNNASELYSLYRSNNDVWPNTFQQWCLVTSLSLQFVAFCLLFLDACVRYFNCSTSNVPNEKIRRILNRIICGFVYVVVGLNFVIQANGWSGPIRKNPSVPCSTSTTEDTSTTSSF